MLVTNVNELSSHSISHRTVIPHQSHRYLAERAALRGLTKGKMIASQKTGVVAVGSNLNGFTHRILLFPRVIVAEGKMRRKPCALSMGSLIPVTVSSFVLHC